MRPPLSVTDAMAAVEQPQRPSRGGYDPFTLEEVLNRLRVPGLGIAIIEDFQIHWAKGYGVADVETGAPVNTDTLFQAGSVSKPVAVMAVLRAVQENRFSLDQDINTILRSWKLPEDPFTGVLRVTPRMLASHTSGLGDGFGFPGYEPDHLLPDTHQILTGESPCNVAAVSMERAPMQAMKYSGGGTTILELALTDVLQRPFPQILREQVLNPLGMRHSDFEQPLQGARAERSARGHDEKGRSMGVKWHVYPELAAAGLWSTPSDLANFAIEVQLSALGRSNRVLSTCATQEMLNPLGIGDFAVGFMIERQGQGWYFRHGGRNWGFTALLIAHKVKGYGLVIMCNASNALAVMNEVKERVERAYGWDSLERPIPRNIL